MEATPARVGRHAEGFDGHLLGVSGLRTPMRGPGSRMSVGSGMTASEMGPNCASFQERQEMVRLFTRLADARGHVTGKALLAALAAKGIRRDDVRLKRFMSSLEDRGGTGARLNFQQFRELVSMSKRLISDALGDRLVVPNFADFCRTIRDIYRDVKENRDGANASYIPQLAKVPSDLFAVAVCTVDGQQFSIGDAKYKFSIQSCSKPITYALALEEHGTKRVHHHVGHEPSGVKFNTLTLLERPASPTEFDEEGRPVSKGVLLGGARGAEAEAKERDDGRGEGKVSTAVTYRAHNMCVNSGAITCASLVRPNLDLSERIDAIVSAWCRLTASDISINSSVFLSERATADRNFALAYYLTEYNVLPRGGSLTDTLELYIQACSLEASAREMAVMAATLANGGLNVLTADRVFNPLTVQCVLSQMTTAGLYDYSGEWSFKTNLLPAKSGVGGCIYAVVPNLMGIAVFSPRLDEFGNSVRAVKFLEELTQLYTFHGLGDLRGVERYSKCSRLTSSTAEEEAERSRASGGDEGPISKLVFIHAAAQGDLTTMKHMLAKGISVDLADWDLRTALHLAASEGRMEAVRFLLAHGADPNPRDRWRHTPLSDALNAGHREVADVLSHAGAHKTTFGAWRRAKLVFRMAFYLTRMLPEARRQPLRAV